MQEKLENSACRFFWLTTNFEIMNLNFHKFYMLDLIISYWLFFCPKQSLNVIGWFTWRTLSFIKKQVCFSVCYQSPMFHGTRNKIRNGNHILFWQWVFDVKIIFEIISYIGPYIQGILESFFLCGCSIDSELCFVNVGILFFIFKITNNETCQISYHGLRFLKFDFSIANAWTIFALIFNWHVTESYVISFSRTNQSHSKSGFETGFIKTRKSPSGICGLKFWCCNRNFFTLFSCINTFIEAYNAFCKIASEFWKIKSSRKWKIILSMICSYLPLRRLKVRILNLPILWPIPRNWLAGIPLKYCRFCIITLEESARDHYQEER